jgi:DNA-directed RNA polymerase subunit H (RpoH/RPB5)
MSINSTNSLNPELIPIKKDDEIIRKTILTNIIKMFNARGYITTSLNKRLEEIKIKKDDDTYKIILDKKIPPSNTDKEYIDKYEGGYIMVRIIHQKVQGIAKLPLVKDFLNQYKYNHKLFVFDGISDKVKLSLCILPNTEVFNEAFLMINILEHIDCPEYEILTEEEGKEVLDSYILKKNEMMKILSDDPIVKYFNLKRGDIMRIIRPSEQSGQNIVYRIVAKGNIS